MLFEFALFPEEPQRTLGFQRLLFSRRDAKDLSLPAPLRETRKTDVLRFLGDFPSETAQLQNSSYGLPGVVAVRATFLPGDVFPRKLEPNVREKELLGAAAGRVPAGGTEESRGVNRIQRVIPEIGGRHPRLGQ
jgi:hypothetical protein